MFPLSDENPHFLAPIATCVFIALNAMAWFFVQRLGAEPVLGASVCALGLIPGQLLQTLAAGTRFEVSPGVYCVLSASPTGSPRSPTCSCTAAGCTSSATCGSLSFKDRRYTIDFWVWFRWKPEGAMADYKPLESFEIINGRIDSKSSIVEKKIGDVNYVSARITASISQPWDLDAFPLDNHRLRIHLEDSKRVASEMVFEIDVANSGLGDEINLSGWTVSFFDAGVTTKVYNSNYGDISLPTKDRSEYSRFTFSMDLRRENHEAAIKLLTTMLVAPLVAFAAFLIKPTDVNTRFGVGVGALFAVATSAVIVASAVPDSTCAHRGRQDAHDFDELHRCLAGAIGNLHEVGRDRPRSSLQTGRPMVRFHVPAAVRADLQLVGAGCTGVGLTRFGAFPAWMSTGRIHATAVGRWRLVDWGALRQPPPHNRPAIAAPRRASSRFGAGTQLASRLSAAAKSLQISTMSQPAASEASARATMSPAPCAPAMPRSSEKMRPSKPRRPRRISCSHLRE